MTEENARKIIEWNFQCREGSLIYSLHERNLFSTELFWDLSDSITTVVNMSLYEEQLTEQISSCYQFILKNLIWHFDPKDECSIKDLPVNYVEYIDWLGMVILAYYRKNPQMLSGMEDLFELER